MKLPLIFALLLFAASHLYGQIGQTGQATSTIFGKPLGSPHNSGPLKIATYRTSAFEIIVAYKGDKAVYLIYQNNGGKDWTYDQVMEVLNSNSPGGKGDWQKTDGSVHDEYSSNAKTWKTKMNGIVSLQFQDNKTIRAEFHPESKALVIWDSSSGLDAAAILGQNAL